MNNKNTKVLVDLLMTIFLILSFVRWEAANFAFHAIVGIGCTLFFALHILIHRKWIASVTKSCLAGKLNPSIKWKYIVNMLLLAFWAISIVTGFLAIIPFSDEAGGRSLWGGLHGITARIGLLLVVVHAIQHWPQIRSYLGIRKHQKTG